MNKWNNTVIKVLSEEHGRKVIQWWEVQGVDVGALSGSRVNWYYGIVNGQFGYWYSANDIKVIELPEELAPEKTFPRKMWVWDNISASRKIHTVAAKIEHEYGYLVQQVPNNCSFIGYKNACELDEMTELSVEQAETLLKKTLNKHIIIIK